MTSSEAANLIERFVGGNVGDWEWDDFTSVPASDSRLERARLRCLAIHSEYPSPSGYCSAAGLTELLTLAEGLRSGDG